MNSDELFALYGKKYENAAQANMYISMLEADYAAALQDARRYRWWRDDPNEMTVATWNIVRELSGQELDDAIDFILDQGEDEFLAERCKPKIIDLGMHPDDNRRGQAAGLNAERYKPSDDR